MGSVGATAVQVELDLPRPSALSLVEQLERTRDVQVNIRRARVTPGRSWLQLEISGKPRDVEGALRQSRKWQAQGFFLGTKVCAAGFA